MSDPAPIDHFDDLFDNAPCGCLVLNSAGRIPKINATLSSWLGHSSDNFAGKLAHELLGDAGRIFYETHIAPLLRMQGFFHEVALNLITMDSSGLPVIDNAVEHRNSAEQPYMFVLPFCRHLIVGVMSTNC